MKKRERKVGIGFITGRKSFREVLATYLNSWGSMVLSSGDAVELSLFVAYDLEYNTTERKDYTNINIELREMLGSIHFIDRATIQTEINKLCEDKILTVEEAALFFEKGYAGKRNAILYAAAKAGMDAILFLDDDEYPLAVQNTNGIESWTGQQVLSNHLSYIDDADITCGHHCGYISTIPQLGFNAILKESDFQLFIEAISNDVISWDKLKSIIDNGGITYANPEILAGGAVESEQKGNTKFITGSNLCINLTDLTALSPFYNPPGARGEDTFLSTCLLHNRVLRIPCYTFHDGFSVYTSMLKGVLPPKLKHVSTNSKKVVTRFYAACIGWVRYKPLLLYITRQEEYEATIAQMKASFEITLPMLCRYFNTPKFMNIAKELEKYDRDVQKHYKAFETNKSAWQKLAKYLQKQKL